MDDRRHRAGGHAMQRSYAVAQVAEHFVFCVHGTGDGFASVSAGAIQSSIVPPA